MVVFEEELNLLDAFIGEGQGSVVVIDAIDPDDAVFGVEADPKTSLSDIFIGAFPFAVMMTILLLALVAFPQITTW